MITTDFLDTPVLLLIFNRPDHTRRVFERIREVRPRQLFISADGPRQNRAGEEEQCQLTRMIVDQVDWDCEVKTLFRSENLGCMMAVSSGIRWFFDQVEAGIILEDDCLPDLSFFQFAEALLNRYGNQPEVMMISGINFLENLYTQYPGSYFFLPFTFTWGWASWRRAWDLYDLHMEGLDENVKKDFLQEAVPDQTARNYLYKKFLDSRTGLTTTWDYQWLYKVLEKKGLCITPKVNLVSNIGFDEMATHTGAGKEGNMLVSKEIEFPLQHPTILKVEDSKRSLLFFYRAYKSKKMLMLNRIIPSFVRKWLSS